ncbi:Acid phosphatase/vanadium-dependent haloperoxidase-related protein [Rhynchospora pubera]|uniref:Acid phosphatase/vanadium-dependent haloperoxidase-related protein n=1 Tax=Rhynchospora pubera TaxID=906938 RepID=A0AAV8ERP4_9POAL|nr:Acid phosphatase/vanadium-dependent haloperoxidase-related protein [Rhynchospora pubera]
MNLSSVEAMSCSSSSPPFSLLGFSFSPSHKPKIRCAFSLPRKRLRITCLRISVEEISAVVHNKVLVASTISTAIGQLSKPLTKAAINGKEIDWRDAFRSGGMPSTHSASVVAAATSLGLERGFSDSIFGMSVVFAALVMYDAQGVRKEVGYHAQVLNKIIALEGSSVPCLDREDNAKAKTGAHNINNSELKISQSFPLNENSGASTSTIAAKQLDTTSSLQKTSAQPIEMAALKCEPLNESVGHTRVQVLVGAFLGFVVSLIVDTAL